MRKQLISLRR